MLNPDHPHSLAKSMDDIAGPSMVARMSEAALDVKEEEEETGESSDSKGITTSEAESN